MRGVVALALVAACDAHAAYEPAILRAIRSPAELVVQDRTGMRTLRFPTLQRFPECASSHFLELSREVLHPGTVVRLRATNGRIDLYFDFQGETTEWKRAALGAGLARHDATADDDLRAAEAQARAENRGLWGGCRAYDVFTRVAAEKGVSRRLLLAVALTESGVGGRPWPWTLNVAGHGLRYASRDEAHDALVGFLRRGVRSIDVGYMQVNLAHHGRRFSDTWQALDPHRNVSAAADILRESFDRARDVPSAVGRFHSGTPSRARSYFAQVARHFDSLPAEEAK